MKYSWWTLVWASLFAILIGSLVVLLTYSSTILRVVAAATVLLVAVSTWILFFRRTEPLLFYDEERGVLLVFRTWQIEAQSARLLRSVPLGIDVSYSAKKVLQAMSERLRKTSGSRLDFVVHRPVDDNKTRVGFIASRRKLVCVSSKKAIEKLCDTVLEDSTILESAMRASYPHTPIDRARLEDLRVMMTGGTAVVV